MKLSNDARCRCQNCGRVWLESELNPIVDVLDRVAVGETMPPGECPDEECGAFCQFVAPMRAATIRNNIQAETIYQHPAVTFLKALGQDASTPQRAATLLQLLGTAVDTLSPDTDAACQRRDDLATALMMMENEVRKLRYPKDTKP